MIGMGGGIKYTIFKSQGRMRTRTVFTNAAVLTVLIAAVFFFLGLLCSGVLTRLLGADAEVFELTRSYLQVLMMFAPMFMANNLFLCFVRNDGAPQPCHGGHDRGKPLQRGA